MSDAFDDYRNLIEDRDQLRVHNERLRADLSESRRLLESSEAALQEAQRALYRWLPNRIGSEYDDLIAADAMTLMGLESVDGLREIGGEILIELLEKRRLLDEARAQKPVAFRYRIGGPTVEWRYAPGDATLTRSAIVESEPLYAAAPVPAQSAAAPEAAVKDAAAILVQALEEIAWQRPLGVRPSKSGEAMERAAIIALHKYNALLSAADTEVKK